MKNADLITHYADARPGLKPEKMFIKFSAIILFIAAAYSQTNINGFCGFQVIETNPGYSKIYFLDFNEDGYEDILLFGAEDKRVTIHFGNKKGEFSEPIKKYFYFPFINIKKFGKIYNNQVYLLISRKERLAALISFTKYGTVQLLNKHAFDSYPTSLSVADIEDDGNMEALIAGSNFNGLSIIHQKNFILTEEQLFENKIFSSSEFVDVNYDGFPDIVSVDLLKNELVFLINDQFGGFRAGPVLLLDYVLGELRFTDLKSDGIIDFIYSSTEGIKFFIGDSISSYEESHSLVIDERADKIIFDDYNRDGIQDIAYWNKKNGILKASFASNEDSLFNKFVPYFYDKSIIDVASFGFGNSKKIAALSKDGKIKIVSPVISIQDNLELRAGGKPHNVQKFGLRTGLDICFLDEINDDLNIILSESESPLKYYLNFPLSQKFGSFKHRSAISNSTGFVFFTKGERLIETIKLAPDFSLQLKKKFYADYPVIDAEYNSDDNGNTIINTIQARGNKILKGDFHQTAAGKWDEKYALIDSNFINAAFSNLENYPIIYLKQESKEIKLFLYDSINKISIEQGSLSLDSSESSIKSSFVSFQSNQKRRVLSILEIGTKEYFYLSDGTTTEQFKWKTSTPWVSPVDQINFYSSDDAGSENEGIYFYDASSKMFGELIFNFKTKTIASSKIIESDNVNSYFVTSLNEEKRFLIYTDSQNGSIVLREINE